MEVFGGVSVDTTLLHTFLSAPACTDMVYSKELERDVTTTKLMYLDGEGDTAPENFGIYSFIEHDQFDLFM